MNVIGKHNDIAVVDALPIAKPFLTTYIIIDEEIAIIDCGPKISIPQILESLKKLKVEPSKIAYILLTHIHIDHAGGAGELIKHLPNARVVIHRKGIPHMINPETLWRKTKETLGNLADFYGEISPIPKERIIEAREGEKIELGNNKIIIWETPGHASHSVTYEIPDRAIIFPGDLAGIYIEPWNISFPTTPKPFNAEKTFTSIEKLIKRKPKTICFPHYGVNSARTNYLARYREKLKLWIETVNNNIAQKEEDILRIIMAKDKELARSIKKILRHKIWRESIMRTIKGIKSYITWKSEN